MILVLDIGNSRIKWAAAEEERLVRTGAVAHGDPARVAETLGAEWGDLRPDSVHGISVAAPSVWRYVDDWSRSRWGLTANRLTTPADGGGIRVAYAEPAGLGVDRWAAMVGGRARSAGAYIVIDCGTATTVDVVDATGRHVGGLITAGLDTLRSALGERAHHLARSGKGEIALLATDTATAIRSGTLLAQASSLDGLIDRVRRDALLEDAEAIITGGDAATIAEHMTHAVSRYPHLVLEGLARYLATEAPK